MNRTKRRFTAALGLVLGVTLGMSGACAGKGKRSQTPEECMSACEQEECGYDPYQTGNDEYLDCLEACQGKCS